MTPFGRTLSLAALAVAACSPARASDAPEADASSDAGDAATPAAPDDARAADATDALRDSTSPDGLLASEPDGSQVPGPCNGDPGLCAKTYDEVAYPTAHSAMAYAFPPFPCPAQSHPVRTQLDRGIRALDLEVHTSSDLGDGGATLALCLGACASGELPLGIALADVSAFLAVNPREVVTLLVGGGADAAQMASAITAAGLDAFALTRATGDAWPTLLGMITSGTRVVVLAEVTGTAPAWMLPLWTYVRETGRQFTSPVAMTCDIARGSTDAPLFMLNEFLVDGDAGVAPPTDAGAEAGQPLAPGCDDPALAHVAGAEPFFMNRVTACVQQRGVKPTFVSVDDFDDGDVSGVVRSLNQ